MKLKCNRISFTDHAKDRLGTRCPGMKMGTARSKIQHKIAEAQRKGVKTDWDGAVQIRFWRVPVLWAVCYALLEGGWAVATIFREGWIDDMEECEKYGIKTEEMISDEEYMEIQYMLTAIAQRVNEMNLKGFLDRLNRADSIGAILHPTLYRDAMPGLEKIKRLANGARSFQLVVREIMEKERWE